MSLNYRQNTLFVNTNSEPGWASQYLVTLYEVGAHVASASSARTITVRAGHGFAANDKLINIDADDIDGSYRTVESVTSTTLTIPSGESGLSVAVGEKIVNLGPDTGTTTPNYDGSPFSLYQDMAGAGSALTNATVSATTTGGYEYWTSEAEGWELVRTLAGVPVSVIPVQSLMYSIGPGNATANTATPSGATAYDLAVYDTNGTLLGYVPVYGSRWT